MINIAIFDDTKTFLESIKILLVGNEKYQLCGSFNNAVNALKKVDNCKPDIIIMDIKMPEVSGIEAVKIIKSKFPNIQIIMQTVFDDDQNIFAAICAGASGYILKGTSPDKMLEAIDEVAEGGSPMSPQIARKVLSLFQSEFCFKNQFYDLSPREKDILSCLVGGQSYKMIGNTLFISRHTVNAHIRKIYEKLHVNTAQEAIALALKQKLV